MGFRSVALSILPLLLLTPPALAQEQNGSEPVFNLPSTKQPPADPTKQGPELDVFRGAPVTVKPPPPVFAPTVPTPALPPVLSPPQAAPQQQAPATTPQQRPTAPASSPEPAPVVAPASGPGASTPQRAPQAPSQPAPEAAPPAPAPAPAAPPAQMASEANPWPWIVGGLLAMGAVLGAWLLRRRRSTEETWDEPAVAEEEPGAPAAATPRPAPVPPAPQPVAAPPPPAPAQPVTDRPWIELAMEVRSARLSLMGATINYVLTLHNRGPRTAEDLLIRSLIANADAGQQVVLQQFFAGSAGLPTHSVVAIAPGERQSVAGELRLLPDQIAPVQMGDRALLIPLLAFDVQYRWSEEGNPAGAGRTGRAFIVGQEKTPPADRLSPFRLDLGPRQYRAPGSRATALELAS